jgi:phage/plasmid primase-like uncharacterized protein
MAFPEKIDIGAARARPIERVAASHGLKLRRSGAEYIGPCPKCGGNDRFAVNIRKNVFNCRGCQTGGDVIGLVRFLDNCTFFEAVTNLTGEYRTRGYVAQRQGHQRQQDNHEYAAGQLAKAVGLWRHAAPISGTLAEQYLREARGYHGPMPSTLRSLPANGSYPAAMVAAFGIPGEPEPGVLDISDDALTGIHLTRLTADGRKQDGKAKTFLGLSSGSPIVLAPVNDLLGLAIAEGVEDALSAHEVTGLGAWAAGAAGRMPALAAVIPDYVEAITIYAHEDHPGQRDARSLAEKIYARHGETIEIRIEGASVP